MSPALRRAVHLDRLVQRNLVLVALSAQEAKLHETQSHRGRGNQQGDTSKDFRDHSKVHQCWDCDSSGELTIEEPTFEQLESMAASKRLQ